MNLVLALAFGALLVVSSERCLPNDPEFTVVQKHQDYEEREYQSLVWVSASEKGTRKSRVFEKLQDKLFDYLLGGNDREMLLGDRLPVCTKKRVRKGLTTYTMYMPLRLEQSEDPPKPKDLSIKVVRKPKTTYFVRSFDEGADSDRVWDDQAAALRASLPKDGANVASFYYMCFNKRPCHQEGTVFEVWLKKT